MKLLAVSSLEWTYPDRFEYPTGGASVVLDSPKGGLTGFQVLLKDLESCPIPALELAGAEADFFEMLPIPVEKDIPIMAPPPKMEEGAPRPEPMPGPPPAAEPQPHFPERKAPFYVYDCLKPMTGEAKPIQDTVALYVRVKAPETAGTYAGCLKVAGGEIAVTLNVADVAVPAETLQNVYWYSSRGIAEKHGLQPGSPEAEAMEEKYLALMRYMRQTVLYVSYPQVTAVGENEYAFDFSRMEAELDRGVRLGFQVFGLPSLAGRKSWKEPELYTHGLNVLSYEGYCYIRQLMTALRAFLKSKGLLGKLRMGVSDEPNASNEVTYRALAGIMRRYCPELILTEALSYCNIHGALNTYVPLNAEYQRHQKEFETFRAAGDEIWQYVCCGPRGEGYINRFMDYPLLSTRYQYWGNYAFDLTGYLHWAFFQPQPGQDLFTQSCPEHHNADSVSFLPSGDTHLCYNGTDGPWMSIRLEMLRQSAEEYEWFRLLNEKKPELAREICGRVFRSFNDVEYDPAAFAAARQALLKASAE